MLSLCCPQIREFEHIDDEPILVVMGDTSGVYMAKICTILHYTTHYKTLHLCFSE